MSTRSSRMGLVTLCLGGALASTAGQAGVTSALWRQGRALFVHDWAPDDPLAAGDGLGPLFNDTSCASCHCSGGAGGASGTQKNVTLVEGEVVHERGDSPQYLRWRRERLSATREIEVTAPDGTTRTQAVRLARGERNTPALWGIDLIDQIPDEAITAQLDAQGYRGVSGRLSRGARGEPGRFGWKGDVAHLEDFVRQACSNELGLSVQGAPQPPLPFEPLPESPPADDLTEEQVLALTTFVRAMPRPRERPQDSLYVARQGRERFAAMGCASCHVPDLGGVEGLYSDLLLHDMGPALSSAGGSYGRRRQIASSSAPDEVTARSGDAPAGTQEWRTPPLWGVADSAPYLHNGAAPTLHAAIAGHGGEAAPSVAVWRSASPEARAELMAFLESLRLPAVRVASLH